MGWDKKWASLSRPCWDLPDRRADGPSSTFVTGWLIPRRTWARARGAERGWNLGWDVGRGVESRGAGMGAVISIGEFPDSAIFRLFTILNVSKGQILVQWPLMGESDKLGIFSL